MIACLDVQYHDTLACAAAVTFYDWSDAVAATESVVQVSDIQPYQPGEFFRRELPCLLAVLQTLPPVDTVVIDGYVWLDSLSRPGLGAHLHQALEERIAVIGVAKTRFRGAHPGCEVFRGTSQRPLFVTSVGMPSEIAADHVRSMHGHHRMPTLLVRADKLSRSV